MNSPLLSYYGDDLTGSTDVMEALAANGIPTVLFLERPDAAQRARFSHCRALGLAGTSRSQTPDWMDTHLKADLVWLKSLNAEICHYKVCSTFDSSPETGSIGRAIDIGQNVFAQAQVPLIVGAPQLRRYTAFGHLFAAYQGQNYRIDRHPVMSRHPVTPMLEADLRVHLQQQTASSIGLIDLTTLHMAEAEQRHDMVRANTAAILMFDVADPTSQHHAGQALWAMRKAGGYFVAGSSGVEYALLGEWQRLGLAGARTSFATPGAVDRMAVVSGSCSPTTERQIRHAQAHGFDTIALDPKALASGESGPIDAAIRAGLNHLAEGRSVILHTALGATAEIDPTLDASGRKAIGRGLGKIQAALVERAGLQRGVIAGGDTSSHALTELGIYALTICLPLPATPGSPLCTAYSNHPAFNGVQIALKGGQVGADDYFSAIRNGRA